MGDNRKKNLIKFGCFFLTVICVIGLIGWIRSRFFMEQQVQLPEVFSYSEILNLQQFYTEPTEYEKPEGTGNVTAAGTPKVIEEFPAFLEIRISNHGNEVMWEWEHHRLEKKVDGDWYSPEIILAMYEDAIVNVIGEENEQDCFYRVNESAEPGTYRIVFLFLDDWCSVEFQVV